MTPPNGCSSVTAQRCCGSEVHCCGLQPQAVTSTSCCCAQGQKAPSGWPAPPVAKTGQRCGFCWPEPPIANLRTKKDRKSTRLNSSHVSISYAVFCLKKKKHLDEHDAVPDSLCPGRAQ